MTSLGGYAACFGGALDFFARRRTIVNNTTTRHHEIFQILG